VARTASELTNGIQSTKNKTGALSDLDRMLAEQASAAEALLALIDEARKRVRASMTAAVKDERAGDQLDFELQSFAELARQLDDGGTT
jgi:hypothetical protein